MNILPDTGALLKPGREHKTFRHICQEETNGEKNSVNMYLGVDGRINYLSPI
jgi:hypothetical protein